MTAESDCLPPRLILGAGSDGRCESYVFSVPHSVFSGDSQKLSCGQ